MIVTVEEPKRSMPEDMAKDVDDVLLAELIAGVTETAEIFTHTYLDYGTYAELFDGKSGVTVLPLKGIYIWAIDSVEFSDVEQSSTWFSIYNELGGVYSKYGFPAGTANVKITYKAGYSTSETGKGAPDGLKRAIINEVVLQYDYLKSKSRTGEQIVDLKKDFLHSGSEKYFNRIKRRII